MGDDLEVGLERITAIVIQARRGDFDDYQAMQYVADVLEDLEFINRSDEPSERGGDNVRPRHFTLRELEKMSTRAQGQADDLKYETSTYRVWLSRCTVADGEPYNHKVTVEHVGRAGQWVTVEEYQAQ